MKKMMHIWQLFLMQNYQKKRLIFIAVISSLFISICIISFSCITDSALLYAQLKKEDAEQIIAQLEKENIKYQIQNDGQDILIAKNLVNKVRMSLMSKGLTLQNPLGFELFDKSDFGMTDFAQKINYQRALQGELEKTINTIAEVQYSRVHLVLSENHFLSSELEKPKAAVSLYLKKPLSLPQIKSIQALLAGSIRHLRRDDVVVLDQNGRTLSQTSSPDNKQLHAKKQLEDYLANKLMEMLHLVFPQHRVAVKVDVRFNYDRYKTTSIKPQQIGRVTHEKETQHASSAEKNNNAPRTTDLFKEKDYEFGHEKKFYLRANGTIEHLSISVLVPMDTSLEMLEKIKQLAKTVVGFDNHRGDTISVEALALPPHKQSKEKKIEQSFINIKWVIFVALIIVLMIFLHLAYRRYQLSKREFLLNQLNEWLIENE